MTEIQILEDRKDVSSQEGTTLEKKEKKDLLIMVAKFKKTKNKTTFLT